MIFQTYRLYRLAAVLCPDKSGDSQLLKSLSHPKFKKGKTNLSLKIRSAPRIDRMGLVFFRYCVERVRNLINITMKKRQHIRATLAPCRNTQVNEERNTVNCFVIIGKLAGLSYMHRLLAISWTTQEVLGNNDDLTHECKWYRCLVKMPKYIYCLDNNIVIQHSS